MEEYPNILDILDEMERSVRDPQCGRRPVFGPLVPGKSAGRLRMHCELGTGNNVAANLLQLLEKKPVVGLAVIMRATGVRQVYYSRPSG